MNQPLQPMLPNEFEMAARRRSFVRLMLFMAFVFLCAFGFQAWNVSRLAQDGIGDGKTVESYGYDLSNLTVDRQFLTSSGTIKDGHATLFNPPSEPIERVDEINETNRTKGRWTRIVVSDDVVIGIEVNGHARAYPIRYIQWHEILNDTLGEEPICITFQPPCGSALAFSRRFGEEVKEFSFSGLLYQSNLVMYDKQADPAAESLWSQMLCNPIAGPAVEQGLSITPLPIYVGSWEKWRELHPQSSVFGGVPERKANYKRDDFERYYRQQKLWFDVSPAAAALSPAEQFTPMLGRRTDTGWELREYWPQQRSEPPTDQPTMFALRFAWQAMHGDAMIIVPNETDTPAPQNTDPSPIF